MRPQRGVLAGVCRPVPEDGTFVIPVFRTDDGNHVIQRVADGWIEGLEEVSLAEEFVPLASAVRVSVGDAAICGIELDDFICIGWAPSLGNSPRMPAAPALSVFRRKEDETFDRVVLDKYHKAHLWNSLKAALHEQLPMESTSDLFGSAVRDFMQALGGYERPPINKLKLSLRLAAFAASLFLGVALAFVAQNYMQSEQVITTGASQWHHMTLPDGTAVHIDARSRVEVAYTDKERIVHVYEGSAVFDVAKDSKRPFIARTHLIDALALGTRFGVSLDPGVTTTVSEGVVRITGRGKSDGKAMMLKAGEELLVSNSALISPQFAHVDAERKLQWATSGVLVLSGLTVSQGVEQLNRRNRTQIVVESAALGARVVEFASVKVDSPETYAKLVAQESGITMILDKENGVIRLSE